jgi:hypothetical protein
MQAPRMLLTALFLIKLTKWWSHKICLQMISNLQFSIYQTWLWTTILYSNYLDWTDSQILESYTFSICWTTNCCKRAKIIGPPHNWLLIIHVFKMSKWSNTRRRILNLKLINFTLKVLIIKILNSYLIKANSKMDN